MGMTHRLVALLVALLRADCFIHVSKIEKSAQPQILRGHCYPERFSELDFIAIPLPERAPKAFFGVQSS